MDTPNETVIRRDTHLLPPGVTEQVIAFGDIDRIREEFIGHRHGDSGQDAESHYRLSIITQDGRDVEIGWGSGQRSLNPPAHLKALAQAITNRSGAELKSR